MKRAIFFSIRSPLPASSDSSLEASAVLSASALSSALSSELSAAALSSVFVSEEELPSDTKEHPVIMDTVIASPSPAASNFLNIPFPSVIHLVFNIYIIIFYSCFALPRKSTYTATAMITPLMIF